MSDGGDEARADEPATSSAPSPGPEPARRTGVPAVDRALTELGEQLDGPVAEHTQAYEQALERLTQALDPVEARIVGGRG